MSHLRFESLDPQVIDVEAGNRVFQLREATAQTACDYQNAVTSCTVYNDKGVRCGVRGLADADLLLVSQCLVELKDGGYHAVSIDEIKSWPDRVKDALFRRICQMSNINQPDTKEELLEQKAYIEKRLAEIESEEAVKNGSSSSETPAT